MLTGLVWCCENDEEAKTLTCLRTCDPMMLWNVLRTEYAAYLKLKRAREGFSEGFSDSRARKPATTRPSASIYKPSNQPTNQASKQRQNSLVCNS